MYHIFFIYLSDGGYLGCFQALAIVNIAVMKIAVYVTFRIVIFSEYISSSGIPGPYGRFKELSWWLKCEECACNTGDLGSIPGTGQSPGEGNDNSLQYSYLESLMERGAWWVQSMGFLESDMTNPPPYIKDICIKEIYTYNANNVQTTIPLHSSHTLVK